MKLDDTVTQTAMGAMTVAVRAAEAKVVAGPDLGVSVRVADPTFTVGSGPDARLRLTDPTVSREHFCLELTPNGVLLRDSGSKNGTWLGGVRVDRALLASDVMLTIGGTTIAIVLDRDVSLLTISERSSFGGAIGHSNAMRHVFAYLEKVAASEAPLLLEGESGIGKEVLAQAVHTCSGRAQGPFVPIDCGAIPPHLVESELFGHEKGAFTGAHRAHVGLFAEADGGTVFLDEVGELPVELQPKLLRVLEAKEVRPVGSNRYRKIDVRVVAATNRDLDDRVTSGEFRQDLFYRIAVARLRVPPLRERQDDIVPLALHFLRQLHPDREPHLPPDVAAMFRSHSWPGNVRELRNAVGRFALLGARDRNELLPASELRVADDADVTHMPFHDARRFVIDRFERNYFRSVLDRAQGNVSKAAELANISRSTYYRMLERTQGGEPIDDE